jgi:hypothetical protein
LRSQNAILKLLCRQRRKHVRRAFTVHGIPMLPSVLGGERTVQVDIAIVRVLVRCIRSPRSHAELTRRLDALEKRYEIGGKNFRYPKCGDHRV